MASAGQVLSEGIPVPLVKSAKRSLVYLGNELHVSWHGRVNLLNQIIQRRAECLPSQPSTFSLGPVSNLRISYDEYFLPDVPRAQGVVSPWSWDPVHL